jgi:alpha-tubulin suppressor-like RCC1 family protein
MTLGYSHSVGVTPKGELFTWGRGGNGSLGHGNNDTVMKPTHVKNLMGKTVAHVCCSDHTAVVTTEGELFTW